MIVYGIEEILFRIHIHRVGIAGNEQGFIVCQKSKVLRDGKCRAFRYDPLLRVPQSVSISGNFTAEDFKL